jgi:glycosyltransferase involved in cell wall biosynthesis
MNQKVKVLHLITMLELGGAQQNTLYTVSHLNKNYFDAYLGSGPGGILTNEAYSLLNDKFHIIPHLIREINPIYDLAALFELIFYIKKIKPMIIHTHSSKAGILGRTAAYLTGVPIIIHSIHGYGFTKYQNIIKFHLLKFAEKIVSKYTTHFICVSEANKKQGIEYKLFDNNKVSLIRSGIELNLFRGVDGKKIRQEFSIEEEQPLVSMIACFKPQKAPSDFIKVAELVHKQKPQVRFMLVGDGVLKNDIQKMIEEKNLKECVFLTGWRRDIPQILAAADIIVLTSLWEGLPRTIIEAIASKKPIVATKVDGTADIIQDGYNGFLAQPHDIETIASKIITLLEDKALYNKFIHNSQAILNEFDINLMVEQQEKLYLELIKNFKTYDPS